MTGYAEFRESFQKMLNELTEQIRPQIDALKAAGVIPADEKPEEEVTLREAGRKGTVRFQAKPREVCAIQLHEENLHDVFRFLHTETIPFSVCSKGHLTVPEDEMSALLGGASTRMEVGDWMAVGRGDNEGEYDMLSDAEFSRLYEIPKDVADIRAEDVG